MFWIILLGIVIALIWYYFVKPLSYWKNQGVKQSKPWIFFGDSWVTLFRRLSPAEYIEKLYYMYPNSRYSGFYQFNLPTLIIKDPELIKQILIRDFDHFTDHKLFIDPKADPLWGGNLAALEGKRWREMRATLTPIFTSSKIKNMFVLMNESAETFVQYFLNKNQDLTEIEIKDIFARYTNDVIATTAFGIKVDSLNEPDNVFYQLGKDITNFDNIIAILKIMGTLMMPKVLRMLKITMFSKEITTFFTNVIKETIRTREEKGIVRPDLINLLLEARKGVKFDESEEIGAKEEAYTANFKQLRRITDEDIASQAFVFFFGGFDTVSTALCFGCHELAFNKDVQAKLRQEIRKTYNENNGKITYDVMLQMKYLNMVVSEILRKWSPAIFFDRICTKPYTIEPVNSNEVPLHLKPGDVLWIPVHGIHNDPAYFKNPHKFEPERFSDEDSIQPYTYMPFSLGPRNCIGNRFALLEIKVLLFHLLKNFEIVPTGNTPYPPKLSKSSFLPKPAGRVCLGLQRIKN